jgi:tetratricopeptide (TPR) repeat protein
VLFDLKGKRKRLVQVTYLALAVLFGGSLVLFGTGSSVSGGLIDAITGNGNGSSNNVFENQVKDARKAALRNPKSEQAWLDLVRADFNLAASPTGSDAQTGQLTDEGKQAVIETVTAWERYLKLKPKKPDAGTAQFAAIAYGALQEYGKSVDTQEIVTRARPNANAYFQLADFAYRAGEVKRGDRAAKKAVSLTPKDQQNSVRDLVKQAKKQGAQIVKAVAQAKKQAKQQNKGGQRGSAFGPIPGQGSQSSGGGGAGGP